jgi:RND superfamily putative drug exporter
MPILLILLVFVFGSIVSALLPLVIGGIAILGAFTALKLISLATDVSIFSISIVTIMGLGLAIDYGLFMVSRFREELRSGENVQSAVVRTMTTAGRTVTVSAVTIAVSLAGLLIFPQTFLRSMGFGGIAAVMIAALGAITVLPALMAVLGHRVDAWSVRPLLRRIGLSRIPESASAHDQGFWYRWANIVMSRPVRFIVATVAILLVLATPFLHVAFGGVDARVLPTSSESRQVSDTMIRDFPGGAAQPIRAVLTLNQPTTSAAGPTAVSSYLAEARGIPGVSGAAISQARGQTAAVEISYQGEALDPGAKAIVHQLRALPHPVGVSAVHVGGDTAEVIDRLADLGSRLPWMALIVALATFVLLFLAFGSVVVPIKAIAMNVLSLAATFGVVTWIFQDGHVAGWLNFTPTGTVDATQPILVFAVVFGLSMDYEVFLLSRIREQYDRTGDNRLAVAAGLQRTGRIITSAALLLMVVIGAFSTSSVTFIKLIGVAMFFGILIDATIVRSVLVPATMRVLGDSNWWAPAPLRRFYRRYGLQESEQAVADRDLGLTAVGSR